MMKFFLGFKYALSGWKILFTSERNAKVHLLVALITIGLSFYLPLNYLEWSLIILCIAIVLAAEGMNTAIEALANRITTNEDYHIKLAKDLAAGAVLFVSFGAAIVGLLILLPKLISTF